MNTGHGQHNDEHGNFDAKLRQVHAQAIDHVSPRTSVQLRPQRAAMRPAPAAPRLRAWPLAATCAIALVAGGLFLRQSQDAPAESAPAVAITDNGADNNDPADVYAALDESPELYLWLASNDTQLALE
jgi:hypothetical protein